MQHHGGTDFAADPARIAAELKQGLRGGFEQQVVDESGVAAGDRIEVMRQCENEMPVTDVEESAALLLDPAGLFESLALGAVAVATRGILNGRGCAMVSQRATKPPSAAVRQLTSALATFRRSGVNQPNRPCCLRCARTISAISSAGRARGTGGQMACTRSTVRHINRFQQVEWRHRVVDRVHRQMQVAHGGADGGMSESPLDDGQADAGLKQRGGIASAEAYGYHLHC